MNYYGYGHQSSMGMGYWSFGEVIAHVIVFIVIIAIILWILRYAFGWHMGGPRSRMMRRNMMMGGGFSGAGFGHHDAIDILKERYAKGEIDKEEFEEKKKVLSE